MRSTNSTSTSTPARRAAAATLTATAVGAVVLLPAAGASAHVTVNPVSTAAGSFTVLDFRVPTESDTAGTVRLEVTLPTETPLTSVRTKPIAGWDAEVVRGPLPAPVDVDGTSITEAPLSVVWTAQPGNQVGPGQYQDFSLSVGPLPEEGTELVMPASQTYSDGEVVDWAEPTPESGEEPELPAPVLVTTAAGESHDAAHGSDDGGVVETDPVEADAEATAEPATAQAASTTAADSASSDTTARVLGGGGLVLGAGALALSVARGRRRA